MAPLHSRVKRCRRAWNCCEGEEGHSGAHQDRGLVRVQVLPFGGVIDDGLVDGGKSQEGVAGMDKLEWWKHASEKGRQRQNRVWAPSIHGRMSPSLISLPAHVSTSVSAGWCRGVCADAERVFRSARKIIARSQRARARGERDAIGAMAPDVRGQQPHKAWIDE